MKTLENSRMKCIVRVPDKKDAEVQHVKELLADGWKFCPKSEWREKVRDAKPAKKKVKKVKKNKKDFGTHKLVPIKTRPQGKK